METWKRDPKGEEGIASGLFGLQRTFEVVLKKEECSLGTGRGGREVQEASMSQGRRAGKLSNPHRAGLKPHCPVGETDTECGEQSECV